MPRDRRLFMTFPIDFWLHPKVAPLSDAAFRAFVEINGYSRMHGLDGRVPIKAARSQWKPKALSELVGNHPARPSLSVDGDEYVIWNYSEHQQTTAGIEAAAAVSRANGARGGRPPKRNPAETRPGSESNPGRTWRKAESESELREDQDIHTSSDVLNREGYPQGPDESESVEAIRARQAALLGVDFAKVKGAIAKKCGRFPSPTDVVRIIATVLDRSRPPIKSPTGAVLTSVENDWAEWQQLIDEAVAS